MVSVPTSTANRMPADRAAGDQPELKSVPAPSSDSSRHAASCAPPTTRTSPPAKIGAVVAIGRYEPTANDSEWMPHSSSVIDDEHADQHEPPRQVLAEQPLDDRRHQRRLRRRRSPADPMPNTRCRYSVVSADDERRGEHADDQPDLLVERRRADDVAGLEVLRRVAGVGRRDADDGADAERDRARRRRRSSRARRRAGR